MLRKGPQDVPASGALFVLVLIVGMLADFLIVLDSTTVAQAILLVFVINGMTVIVVSLLLWLLGHAARLLQTLIAMLGSSLMISILQLPVILVGRIVSEPGVMIGFLLLIFLFWSVLISAHIFRHALSIHFIPAGVLAIGYLMLNITVFKLLIPQAG